MPSQKPKGKGASDTIRYPIPKASADAWRTIWKQRTIPLNPGLIFYRFVQDWGWREQQFRDKEAKKKAWEEIVGITTRADESLLEAWNKRWQAVTDSARAESFSLKTDWRFIAGLGRKGALEVGFTFHRYGFPILPGSSVKGVARAWALIRIAQEGMDEASNLRELDEFISADGEPDSEKRKKYEKWRESAPEGSQKLASDFRATFGTTAVAGQAVFFDAIPANMPTLELDIMNPHYPKYYSGEEFPTDWQSPVPVYFLTVTAKTEFRFAVGWRGPVNDTSRRLQGMAVDWLKRGLQELGAGSKTSAGYGYFIEIQESKGQAPAAAVIEQPQPLKPPSQPTDPQQRQVDDFKRSLEALPIKDVAGQIARFVDQWRQYKLATEYRIQMAEAILERVESARRTRKSQSKKWFQELQVFVSEHKANK